MKFIAKQYAKRGYSKQELKKVFACDYRRVAKIAIDAAYPSGKSYICNFCSEGVSRRFTMQSTRFEGDEPKVALCKPCKEKFVDVVNRHRRLGYSIVELKDIALSELEKEN